jgi:hypothetical protein
MALIFKGVNYVGDVYGSFADANSLSALPGENVNATAITADFGIDPSSNTVYADSVQGGYTDSSTDIATTVSESVADGNNVMLRPLLDFLPDNNNLGVYGASEFRAYYNPGPAGSAGANAFFASYQNLMVAQAKIAQADGAGIFCIGTELDQITGPSYESYWTSLINAVKSVYSGALTYSALWDDSQSPWIYGPANLPAGTGDITTQISFWKQLSYIGIDEYAPISDATNPTLAQLIAGWTKTPTDQSSFAVTGDQSLISYFESVQKTLNMPLLFTELGYANCSDAAINPAVPGYDQNGNPDGATEDQSLQANLYKAFFSAWAGNPALSGVFLWNWEPGGAGISPFSVQGLQVANAVQTGFAACFAAGTRILTATGEHAIETLRPGDLAVTPDGLRPIIWTGRRQLDLLKHPASLRPIRITGGAFAPFIPHRDLIVSPNHAIYADGCFFEAQSLINNTTIRREHATRFITYHHVELPTHSIIYAESLTTESYLDTGNRSAFEGESVTDLFPNFRKPTDAKFCAPMIRNGPQLSTLRARLTATDPTQTGPATPDSHPASSGSSTLHHY